MTWSEEQKGKYILENTTKEERDKIRDQHMGKETKA